MREHRTSGSVEGARGDPRSYSDPENRIAPAEPALERGPTRATATYQGRTCDLGQRRIDEIA
jgi:hypothetical protein